MRKRYMFDTNAFNRLADGHIDFDHGAIRSGLIIFTHVQLHELGATKDDSRRKRLLGMVAMSNASRVSTRTAIWNDTPWGEVWPDNDGVYGALRDRVTALDRISGKTSSSLNLSRDARIAETAIKESAILVTDDANLRLATIERGGQAITSAEFSMLKL